MYKFLCSSIFFVFLCTNLFAVNNEFEEKLNSLRWMAYAPTNFNPQVGLYPSIPSIEKDLEILFKAGFQGIVTYGSQKTSGQIPKIAKNLGFQGVIMGIWDIDSQEEIQNALEASNYVDGYCLGNEGLGRRYELEELKAAIADLKDKTHKPVTTTEQIFDYAKQSVVDLGDWVFPNIHPFLSNVYSPDKAVKWIEHHYKILRRSTPTGKPVLFKEIGYPTKGDYRASEKRQRDFFLFMEMSEIKFVYFEAFDQYWKRHLPVEPHWGLFDKNRRPKRFISERIRQIEKK